MVNVVTGVFLSSLSEFDAVFGRLHRQIVGRSVARIGPEVRRHLFGRAQAGVQIERDVVGREPELGGARPVDLGEEFRRVDLLLQMRVGDPWDGGDPLLQLLGDAQVLGPVVADGTHVDLRRDAEIEDLGHHVGGLEIEYVFRKGSRQHLAQFADISRGRRVALLQRDQDHAVIDADRRAVAERIIVGARRQADIVDDELALAPSGMTSRILSSIA